MTESYLVHLRDNRNQEPGIQIPLTDETLHQSHQLGTWTTAFGEYGENPKSQVFCTSWTCSQEGQQFGVTRTESTYECSDQVLHLFLDTDVHLTKGQEDS